jgi:hypothetical protein
LKSLERRNNHQNIHKAKKFFRQIRLPFVEVPGTVCDPPNTFFQGCWLLQGKLYFCQARVQVGELLHEAGHLALLPKQHWPSLQPGNLSVIEEPFDGAATDLAVEAWDYAAAKFAGIHPIVLFKDFGRRNCVGNVKLDDGNYTLKGFEVYDQFEERLHPGIALLQISGLSQRFPIMERWYWGEQPVLNSDEILEKLKAGTQQLKFSQAGKIA